MKTFLFLTMLLIICYIVNSIKCNEKIEWMDNKYTTSIKGIAIIFVVWAHAGKQLDIGGIQFVAGVGVALFLICSGYGLENSYCKNGLDNYWKKKFFKVYIPFFITIIISFLLLRQSTFKHLLWVLTFVKSNWYLRFLMLFYAIFFCLKVLRGRCGKRRIISCKQENLILILCALCIFVIHSLWLADPTAPFLQARQVFSFPMGVFLAKYQAQIKAFLKKPNRASILCLFLCFVGVFFLILTQLHIVKRLPYIISNVPAIGTCFPLAIMVLIIGYLYIFLFKNSMLFFIGTISYEIFLVHLHVLTCLDGTIKSIFIFVLLTLVLSVVLHHICKRISEKIY